MDEFLLFYYDGNDYGLVLVEAPNVLSACEKLAYSGKLKGTPWEEGVNLAINVSKIDLDKVTLINFAGRMDQEILLSEVAVAT